MRVEELYLKRGFDVLHGSVKLVDGDTKVQFEVSQDAIDRISEILDADFRKKFEKHVR